MHVSQSEEDLLYNQIPPVYEPVYSCLEPATSTGSLFFSAAYFRTSCIHPYHCPRLRTVALDAGCGEGIERAVTKCLLKSFTFGAQIHCVNKIDGTFGYSSDVVAATE